MLWDIQGRLRMDFFTRCIVVLWNSLPQDVVMGYRLGWLKKGGLGQREARGRHGSRWTQDTLPFTTRRSPPPRSCPLAVNGQQASRANGHTSREIWGMIILKSKIKAMFGSCMSWVCLNPTQTLLMSKWIAVNHLLEGSVLLDIEEAPPDGIWGGAFLQQKRKTGAFRKRATCACFNRARKRLSLIHI